MLRPTAYWGFVVLAIASTILGPSLLPILSDYHMSPSSTGPLFFASSCGYVLAALIGGPAGDRWSRAVLLPAGALILGAGLIGIAIAPAWALLALCMFTTNIGSGIVDTGSNALINDVAAPQHRAREQSLLHASFGIGALLGPLLTGAFLATHHGWRGPFALAGIGALVLLVLYRKVSIPPRPASETVVSLRSVTLLARKPFMLVLILMIGVYVGAEVLVGDWAAAFLQKVQGMDDVAAATCVSLYLAGLAAGRLLSALVTRWLSGRSLLLVSCVMSLGASIVLVAAQDIPISLAALVLLGLGFAPIFPLVMAVGGERYSEVAGSVAGLLLAAGSVFAAAIPWLGGVFVQVWDARAAMSLTIPSGALMVGIAWLLLVRAQRQPSRIAAAANAAAAADCIEMA